MPACHAGGHGFESRTHRKKAFLSEGFFVSQAYVLGLLHIHIFGIVAQDKQSDRAQPDVAVEAFKVAYLIGGTSGQ